MKRIALKTLVPVILVLAVIASLIAAGGSYRPPLLTEGERTVFQSVVDFFAFGWHYSREVWFRQSRNWPAMARARLLGFRHRPDHPAYSELREQPLFQLGRLYEMAELPGPATELYLQARLEEPGNRWLESQVGDKLLDLERWGELEDYSREILAEDPGNPRAREWLEAAQAARERGN